MKMKKFDSVEMMRKIRNKLSEDFSSLDYKEQKKLIEKKLGLQTIHS